MDEREQQRAAQQQIRLAEEQAAARIAAEARQRAEARQMYQSAAQPQSQQTAQQTPSSQQQAAPRQPQPAPAQPTASKIPPVTPKKQKAPADPAKALSRRSFLKGLGAGVVVGAAGAVGVINGAPWFRNLDHAIASGTCGDGVKWKLDSAGTFTVSGMGAMKSLSKQADYAWYKHREKIKTVVIEDGCTDVAMYAFYSCKELTKVILPEGLENIGYQSFYFCDSLKKVTIPKSVVLISNYAFYRTGIEQVKISRACKYAQKSFNQTARISFYD